jgi:hypothetical protein
VDVGPYTKGAYGLKKLNSPDAHDDGKKKLCSGAFAIKRRRKWDAALAII